MTIARKNINQFLVLERQSGKIVKSFPTRKDAVFWCKVNQNLLLPDYEWEDEYCIKCRKVEKLK